MKLYPLSPKQRLAWQLAQARICIWEGSVRSGKTIDSLLAWCEYVRESPDGNLAMVGRTERTLKRNIVDVLVEMFGRQRARHVQGVGELWLFGRRVYLYGANNEEAHSKIQGLTLQGAYVDEATTVPESFFKMLLSRLSLPGARLYATMNPDSPMHWIKRAYLDRARLHLDADGHMHVREAAGPDLVRFSFRLRDNETLPAEYVASLEQEYTGLWYDRYILGKWLAAEGAVYDMLELDDSGRHVTGVLPELRQLRLAIDYGTTNPTVALLLGVSAEPRLYVAREWRYDSGGRRTLTDSEYIERLDAWLASGCDGFFVDEHGRGLPVSLEKVICDPSAASFRAAWQRHFQRWPEAADNTVLDGIRDTASLFARSQLVFHESCIKAIEEHAGYVWDDKAQEKGDDRPLKADDHSCDALRYGVRSYRTTWRHWPHPTTRSEEAA